ncbi:MULTISPECIES: hypothetical protein [unclassified Ochrobactrum]|jgi:hypothetical protein|uniref:hypothetical protein n=1 Tax=unclassified Ochrobactrum TaxID=239106 RepID=UPI000DEF1248|nr:MULTISPECIES: hypothetical protein [unclassified Ochrobactrum]MBQ0709754.1 hypothetical protein [Ochrobactrum sp. AP1BH01-1]
MASYSLFNSSLGLYLTSSYAGDGLYAPVYGKSSSVDVWNLDIDEVEPYLESKIHAYISGHEVYLYASTWKNPEGLKDVISKAPDETDPLMFTFTPTGGVDGEYYISATGTSLYLHLMSESIHPAYLHPDAQAWILKAV